MTLRNQTYALKNIRPYTSGRLGRRQAAQLSRCMMEELEARQLLSVDFTAALSSVPSRANTGTSQSITLTVRNRGNERFAGPLTLDVFAVANGTTFDPSVSTRLTEMTPNANIRAGGTQKFKIALPFDSSLGNGNFRLVAVVDPAN